VEYKLQVYKLRLVRSSTRSVKVEVVKQPEDAANALRKYLENEDREHFVALMLDIKGRIIGIHTISVGTINETLVHPREVFKAAILANAHAVIIGHNHPSGEATPSVDDIEVTRELIRAGEYLKIPVLDHIIIGHDGSFVSLMRHELIHFPQRGASTLHTYEEKSPEE
jgi:DNA repair protein RadC